jgi:transcription elongation factor GreA
MIEELKEKLEQEANKLQFELNVTLPNEIRKAVEMGDLRENSEYKAALERQQFVQARLGQLRQRLSKLSQIDVTQISHDKVGLGSRVIVKDNATGAEESYQLVFGDAVEFEDGQVTMSSDDSHSGVLRARFIARDPRGNPALAARRAARMLRHDATRRSRNAWTARITENRPVTPSV